MLITPQLKDIVLNYLVNKYDVGSFSTIGRLEEIQGIRGGALSELMDHFERLGLIRYNVSLDGKKHSGTRETIIFWLNVESHDFIQKGGFYGQQELFKKNVEKLLWEVEKLERVDGPQREDVGEIRKKISEYLGIIANIAAIGGSVSDIIK